MQYTLDSVNQYIKALEEANKGKQYDKEAILVEDLSTLLANQEDKFFFGVLTVGNNVNHCKLKSDSGANILNVNKNSQIIIGFNYLLFKDDADVDVLVPEGQFRGFIVQKS